jgi:galactokinase
MKSNTIRVSAPGRINLIGEHTDYNGGCVLPMAIDYRTTVTGRWRDDAKILLRSQQFPSTIATTTDNLHPTRTWGDYVLGVASELQKRGYKLPGFDLQVTSTVPIGSGLASSAALEVATVGFFDAGLLLGLSDLDKMQIAQTAENNFVGVPCGIMDQYVAVAGKRGHALFLDCRTLEHRLVPLNLGLAEFLICDSCSPRMLANGEYRRRRMECETALVYLRQKFPEIRQLREVAPDQLDACKAEMPELPHRRARHVVTENERVPKAIQCLDARDHRKFGQLLLASHRSLGDDYEVSTALLDLIVDIAGAQPGVYGARLTGAGFGGCLLILLESSQIENVQHAVSSACRDRFGCEVKFYRTGAAEGLRVE